jgi:SP family sugar:H+ symporter-like MFS transporter
MPFHARYVTFLAGTAALGGFLFGFDSAVINGAVVAAGD